MFLGLLLHVKGTGVRVILKKQKWVYYQSPILITRVCVVCHGLNEGEFWNGAADSPDWKRLQVFGLHQSTARHKDHKEPQGNT